MFLWQKKLCCRQNKKDAFGCNGKVSLSVNTQKKFQIKFKGSKIYHHLNNLC